MRPVDGEPPPPPIAASLFWESTYIVVGSNLTPNTPSAVDSSAVPAEGSGSLTVILPEPDGTDAATMAAVSGCSGSGSHDAGPPGTLSALYGSRSLIFLRRTSMLDMELPEPLPAVPAEVPAVPVVPVSPSGVIISPSSVAMYAGSVPPSAGYSWSVTSPAPVSWKMQSVDALL